MQADPPPPRFSIVGRGMLSLLESAVELESGWRMEEPLFDVLPWRKVLAHDRSPAPVHSNGVSKSWSQGCPRLRLSVQFAPPCTMRKQSAWYSKSAADTCLPNSDTVSQSCCITARRSKKAVGSDALMALTSEGEELSNRTSLCRHAIALAAEVISLRQASHALRLLKVQGACCVNIFTAC